MSPLEVFKEIRIGGTSKEDLIQNLVRAGIRFNDYAQTLFEHPSFVPPQKVEVAKLVKTRLEALQLESSCTHQEFEQRVSELGLKLCPLYLGAFLRLDYLDQPVGPYLTLASKKPSPLETFPNGFYIRNFDHTLWLRGYRANGFADWPSDNEFVLLAGR